MADKKISAMTGVAAAADAQELPVNDGSGSPKKVTLAQIKTWVLAFLGSMALKNSVALTDIDAINNNTTLGNVSGGSASPVAMTRTQLTTQVLPFVGSGASHKTGAVPDPGASAGSVKFLREDATWAETATLVGDSGSGGTKGLVPAPAAGDAAAGKFLKADATWAAPSGGGGLSNITETYNTTSPNDTVPAEVLQASGTETHIDIVLAPKGNGGLSASVPDGTSTGGDKRGQWAVDFQRSRAVSGHVASGQSSALIATDWSKATATDSAVIAGFGCEASGNRSLATGNFSIAEDRECFAQGNGAYAYKQGMAARSSGNIASAGDAQAVFITLCRETSNATPTTLTLDGSTSAKLSFEVTNMAWAFDILVVARRTDAADHAAYKITGLIKIDSNAASVAFVGSPSVTVIGESDATWDCTVSANTSDGSLDVVVTGASGKTIRWAADVRLAEVRQ